MNNFLVLCKCNTCFYGFLWPSKALCNVNYKTFFRRLFLQMRSGYTYFSEQNIIKQLNRDDLNGKNCISKVHSKKSIVLYLSISIQVDLFSLKYIWGDNTAHVALTAVVVINTFFVVSEMILYNVPSCQSTPFCIERCALIPILFSRTLMSLLTFRMI